MWGESKEQHDKSLEPVLERARAMNLKLNLDKCQLGLSLVNYIGHTLNAEGLKPDTKKVEGIKQMNYPTSKEELQRFLDVMTYLAKLIPNLPEIASPL